MTIPFTCTEDNRSQKKVLLLFIISVVETISERTTTPRPVLGDSWRDEAVTCSLPPADQDQIRPSCRVPFLGFINKDTWLKEEKKVKNRIVFYQRINSELILQQVKDISAWREQRYDAERSGLCFSCLFHLHLTQRPWHFSQQCFTPLLPKTPGIGFLILQN